VRYDMQTIPLQLSTDELEKACTKWGLKINSTKCKVLSDEPDETIKVYQEEVEKVENFIFLGSSVPTTTLDVKRRIALAAEKCLEQKRHIICCQN